MKMIPLTKGKFAQVDDADYEWLSKYTWGLSSKGYARRSIWIKEIRQSRHVYMHKMLVTAGMPDHKDGDKLNNQRYNLRESTSQQNNRNRRKRLNTSSRFKGVRRDNGRNRYRACITVGKKQIHLGTFPLDKEIEAARAYNKAAIEHFGEFACLNIIA